MDCTYLIKISKNIIKRIDKIILIIFFIFFNGCSFLTKRNSILSSCDEKKFNLHEIHLFKNSKKYYSIKSDEKTVFFTIEELIEFIKKNPNTSKAKEACRLLNNLLLKIESKNYCIAESYFLMHRYKTALDYLKDFIETFPNSHLKEKVLYNICISQYELRMKKPFFKSYERYMKSFPNSFNAKKLKILYKKLVK
ncbi:tetratricopeptide repeat protein [Blattabacterium cuenoti]|uniref:tetratricopeptide repeat protein n=1 Tax=Blattabacterium cuenoti TaxID=1653831 RepID=UPI00163CC1A2|nr:tetratricopeptide repeat protein [Blattabacterium cuenoti]